MVYFDLHDILCEEQTVKLRFTQDVPWTSQLAFSDDTVSTDTLIPRGTVLQMPLWLARSLHTTGLATILAPRQFSTRMRADLSADATAVNLRDLAVYWYRLGAKLAGILPAENIPRVMVAALAGRLVFLGRAIFAPSEKSSDPHQTIFGGANGGLAILDHTEQGIYTATVTARKDTDGWASRSNALLKPLDLYNELKY
jgi:hypothetical protein